MTSPTELEKLRLRREYRSGLVFHHQLRDERGWSLPEAVRVQMLATALWATAFAGMILALTFLFGALWLLVTVFSALMRALDL